MGTLFVPIGVAIFLIVANCSEVAAADLYVDGQAKGGAGTQTAPLADLQAAIDKAGNGDTIHVAEGTYAPIVVRNKSVSLLGGYARGFGERDRDAHATRIAASGKGDVVLFDTAGHSVLDGFFVSGGERGIKSDGWPYAEQHPVIRHTVIEGNRAGRESEGGGIWCKTRISVEKSVIRNNRAGRGAGMFCFAPSIHLTGNVVEGNVGLGDHGGGLYLGSPEAVLDHNLVKDNETGHGQDYGVGGGIMLLEKGTVGLLSFNVVTGNRAPKRGGGVFIDDEATATLTNELIHDNACGHAGGSAIAVDGLDEARPSRAKLVNVTVANHACTGAGNGVQVENGHVEVVSSIFWNNGGDDFARVGDKASFAVRFTLASEEMDGEGNLVGDPGFVDGEAGDFRLRAGSPAIDAGDPRGAFALEPKGGRIDMGAFGNTAQADGSGPAVRDASARLGEQPAPLGPPLRAGGCQCRAHESSQLGGGAFGWLAALVFASTLLRRRR
jgi:hypothetical protein